MKSKFAAGNAQETEMKCPRREAEPVESNYDNVKIDVEVAGHRRPEIL